MAEKGSTAFAQTVALGMTGGDSQAETVAIGEDRYVVGALVGEGGMGSVVEADDRQFSRRVAVKRLRADLGGAAARERFKLEAIITGNLEHPGVPTVYERGVSREGSPFYAMRLVRGRTLADEIEQSKTLGDRLKLIPVIVRVAQTLGFAHEHGVIHRDIKPENIIVGRHGETVVLDWGIAKVRGVKTDALAATSVEGPSSLAERAKGVSGATEHGSIVGTPAYMAPEQATGELSAIDERTDVFAVGALIYHLFAGHGPYADATIADIVARASAADFASLDESAPSAPAGLRAICAKAMARSPSDRYQTAHELAVALESFQTGALSRGSPMANALATGASIGAIGAVVGMTFFMLGHVASMREQGFFALMYPGLALVGIALSIVEWRTRGRHGLAPISLALIAAVFLGAIAATADGFEMIFLGLTSEKVQNDPALFRTVATRGSYEVLGLMVNASMVAVVQTLAWAIARRATLMREREEARPA